MKQNSEMQYPGVFSEIRTKSSWQLRDKSKNSVRNREGIAKDWGILGVF